MASCLCIFEPLKGPGKLASPFDIHVFKGSMVVYPDGRLKSLQ